MEIEKIFSYFLVDLSQMEYGSDAARISTDTDDGEYQR
jgi:hypothetical protein